MNVIDRERVSRELGRAVEWADLLEASFLQVPANLADLEGTRFASEITSEMGVGHMTPRYGLIPGSDGKLVFRLDVDRYRQEAFDVADVDKSIRGFADDIFQVFMAAATDVLVEWMEVGSD